MMMSATMQALVFTDFNRHQLQDVPIPALVYPDDVLVQIKSAGVCGSDLHGYTGQTGRRQPPLVMGHEATGQIAAIGADVKTVQVGQRVAIQPLVYRPDAETGEIRRRLIGMNLPGAYAEYVVVPAENVFPIPDSLAYRSGALTEPLAVAVHAVSLCQVKPYDDVLVIGAGTIGLLTVQVLKQSGAGRVVVSDVNDERLKLATVIGADATINATTQDFDAFVHEFTDGRGFDLTYEAVGITPTVRQSIMAVQAGGTVVWIGNNQRVVEVDMQSVVTREVTIAGTYGMNQQDFQRALKMLADGVIDVSPLVNRRATLQEGETLFDELLADQTIVKCVIDMEGN
jgi:L-iditol 2-dehydrogenase